MKLSDLKAGDVVYLDNGFTCAPAGQTTIQGGEGGPLWFPCCGDKEYEEGVALDQVHDLEGQKLADGELAGISWFGWNSEGEPYPVPTKDK